jgi:uroporphyrinogen III methyltransferase/synthase
MMRMSDMDGWVAFVGAGPGDDGLLTLRAVRLLGSAALIVAAPEVAERTGHLFAADATVAVPAADAAGTVRLLLAAAKDGRLALRLYEGDPLLNGGAGEVAACAKAQVRFEVVPGVPAATAVPGYAGIALTSDGTGELRVIHAAEASQVAHSPGALIITGAEGAPSDLGKMLIAAGWPDTTPFAITWDGTTTEQQTVLTTLGRIGPDLKASASPGLRQSRCSAGGCWCRGPASRPRLSPSGCASTARSPKRCPPSRWNRRAPRSRWSARSRAW